MYLEITRKWDIGFKDFLTFSKEFGEIPRTSLKPSASLAPAMAAALPVANPRGAPQGDSATLRRGAARPGTGRAEVPA